MKGRYGSWNEAIEGLLWIRTKNGVQQLRLNRAQRQYSNLCTEKNIVLKARQVGITTCVAAHFFLRTIAQTGTVSLQVAHNREAAEDIFRIVKRFWEWLPPEMQKGELKTSYCNAREIVFPKLDSQYCVAAANENAGRGITVQHLHCSEVARWGPGGEEALASLRAALVPSGEIVLESTPNGASGLFFEEWQRANEAGYRQHFFPWWYEDSYRTKPGETILPLTEEEEELAEIQGLTLEQIAWRRTERAALRGLAAQEFAEDPVSCFRASGECVFDLEAIERALRGSSAPVELRDNGRLMIWLPRQAGRDYIIGVDPAGGGCDGDYSCAQVIDRELGMQCGEWHGHHPPRELAQKLTALGQEYNRALLAVERNNHGHGVLACLRMTEYPRIFAQKGQDGWLTTAASRPAMIENLAAVLMEEPLQFRSPRLLNECRTFVRSGDGSTGAAAGAHDDCVMAMAIAWAVRAAEAGRGKQLSFASESRAEK